VIAIYFRQTFYDAFIYGYIQTRRSITGTDFAERSQQQVPMSNYLKPAKDHGFGGALVPVHMRNISY
jgi:hypothetical protein